MDALRLIAVYAAACTLALWLAHRFLLPFSRRIGAALLFLPLILTGRAVFTGGFYGPLNIAYGGSAPLAAQAGRLPERTYVPQVRHCLGPVFPRVHVRKTLVRGNPG